MSKNKFPNNIVFDYCIPNGVDKDWKNIIGCFLFYIKDINSVIKAETIEKIKQNSRHYAKRQYTFFNHQLPVVWFETDYNNFNNTIEKVASYIDSN